jgi:outer membrane receptor protein involved in Fe transport
VDFSYIYTPEFVKDLELRFSVLNLLSEDPMPSQNTAGAQSRVGYYNGYGDPRSRVVQVGVTKKF